VTSCRITQREREEREVVVVVVWGGGEGAERWGVYFVRHECLTLAISP
jgi:hypothetical protein